ncbi:MAG: SBBP repeat-containing protein [Anaerolineae bacterium]|nr:SBBP repeat-containing protein [Anaerolineae bacterium]
MRLRLWLSAVVGMGMLVVVLLLGMAFSGETAPSNHSRLLFVENVGQFADSVRFQLRHNGQTWWLTDDAIWIDVAENGQMRRMQLTFPDAAAHFVLEPFAAQDTTISYFQGTIYAAVPVWGGVRYVDLYPGVDLIVQGDGTQLQMRYSNGAERRVLLAGATAADLDVLQLPLPGTQVDLLDDDGMISAENIGSFSATQHLAVEDDLVFSTFIGSDGGDFGEAIAIDDVGAVYIGGTTTSTYFTPTVGLMPTLHGVDVFSLKLSPDGSALDYVIWINPNPDQQDDEDHGLGVGVDAAGNAYVAGWTLSPDLCTAAGSPPGYDPTHNGNNDAFVFRVNALGTAVTYCTYLGGSDGDSAFDLHVAPDGTTYLTGDTVSADFPTTDGTSPNGGSRDLFVASFAPNGTTLQTSTVAGGSATDGGRAIAVDAGNRAYVTGFTYSTNFPVTANAYDQTANGDADAFVVRFASDGETVDYASYLGGSMADRGWGIDVDNSGRAYVTGSTESSNFPTTASGYDQQFNDGIPVSFVTDGFMVRLSSAGSNLNYGSFLGAEGFEEGRAIRVGLDGSVYVGGYTDSADFPTHLALQDTLAGLKDGFLTRLLFGGSGLLYSTYFGGSQEDAVNDIAVNSYQQAYLTGETQSADFPTTAGAYDTIQNGDFDIFGSLLNPGSVSVPTPTPTATNTPVTPTNTPTNTPIPTATPTGTLTVTPTPTNTPVPPTPTSTLTSTPVIPTPTPTNTPTAPLFEVYVPLVLVP